MILATYDKQPGETMDYDIIYTDFFSTRSDTPASVTGTVDAGITLVSTTLNVGTKTVKCTLLGGTSNVTYKVTVRLTTSGGIIKEDEIRIRVKET